MGMEIEKNIRHPKGSVNIKGNNVEVHRNSCVLKCSDMSMF